MTDRTETRIGWLTHKRTVVCDGCQRMRDGRGEPSAQCAIYEVNIRPYRQTCHDCGKVLVDGHESMPILFDGQH